MNEEKNEKPIRVGISQCLLGERVRYDGGHKHDVYLTDVLGRYFEWVPVCPELEVGMGVPREAVRLVADGTSVRMVGSTSGEDWTERMENYSRVRLRQIEEYSLCGFILKSKSPSCGMERVSVYTPQGMPSKSGKGIFADALLNAFPLLPVEEEGRLNDARLRENFIVRVFAYHRLQQLLCSFSRQGLVQFHTMHKYLLLAHSERHYRELGKIVASPHTMKPAELKSRYATLFMQALALKTTTKKNVNVLHHIFGYLRKNLSAEEKQDILAVIDDYYKEFVPLIVPITLLKHYFNKYQIRYITDQVYLNPHPKELMLRNRV